MTTKNEKGGKPIPLTEAAGLLGVDRGTLSSWIKQGCPADKSADGKTWRIQLGLVLRWREDCAVDKALTKAGAKGDDMSGLSAAERYEEARATKMENDAIKSEIEVDELMGSVVRIEDMREILGAALGRLRSRLMTVGPSTGAPLAAEGDAAICSDIVSTAIDVALREIAGVEEGRDHGDIDSDGEEEG